MKLQHQQQSVQPKVHHLHPTVATWWDWNPFHVHHSVREPFGHEELLDNLFGHSLWNDPFEFDCCDKSKEEEQILSAVMPRGKQVWMLSVPQMSKPADNKQGEVVEKKPKMVYHHLVPGNQKWRRETTM